MKTTMQGSLITTFRCNAHCNMCNIWKCPTKAEEEIDYIKRDCLIVAQGLKFMFEQGLNKMTISSCALNNFKETLGGNNKFRALFPVLDVKDDKFIRESYKNGRFIFSSRKK